MSDFEESSQYLLRSEPIEIGFDSTVRPSTTESSPPKLSQSPESISGGLRISPVGDDY